MSENNDQRKTWIMYKKALNGIKLGELPIGTLVKDINTTISGKPIIWKVVDINHKNYPANSVTLITNKVIDNKCFDATEPNNPEWSRKADGNGRYSVSNIRQWLNSDAEAGHWYTSQHSYDAPPNYSTQAGFLTGFSQGFKKALLDTTLTLPLHNVDGGGTEVVVDKVFLASHAELNMSATNKPATDAVIVSLNTDAKRAVQATYFLRTVQGASEYGRLVGIVQSDGRRTQGLARGVQGIRPLCNLSTSTLVSFEPDTDGCYIINHFI